MKNISKAKLTNYIRCKFEVKRKMKNMGTDSVEELLNKMKRGSS